jgi:polyhydroxybutyrate depolymerase
MLLHGATDSAEYAEKAYHYDEKSESENFILVLPDALGDIHAWNSYGDSPDTKNDLAFLTTLLESLPKTYAIDTRRIYVTGHSSGAIMTYRLAGERPDLIAAVGIVAGLVSDFPPPKGPVPIIAFHGRKDETLEYTGMAEALAFWAKTNRCPEKPATSEPVSPTVTRQTWTPAPGGADMVAYTLDNGNHMWPGGNIMPGKSIQPVQDLSATNVMWTFFKSHPHP